MSELKEVKLSEMNAIKLGLRDDKLYFKSEADKVIAYHKYKRCLAMARWCRTRAYYYVSFRENSLYWVWKSDRAYKWYKRWRELAEKLKPNNSTAQ